MSLWDWLFHRRQREEELDEEVQAHLRMAAQERMEQGETAEQARTSALREFGNVTLVKEVTRDMWGFRWLESLAQDLRYGARQLRKNPGFTVVAVITLALGIGVNTAIFSLFHDTVLARLPISHPQELVQLKYRDGTQIGVNFNWPEFEPLLAPQPALPGLFACLIEEMNLRSGGFSERIRAHLVSGSYYSTLGVKAFLGRTPRHRGRPAGGCTCSRPQLCVLGAPLRIRSRGHRTDGLP